MRAKRCWRCEEREYKIEELKHEVRANRNIIRDLERECNRLGKQLDVQQKINKELNQRLVEATRAAKRQAAPFARARRRHRPKRPGRRCGHAPAQRAYPEHVDEEFTVALDECPHCGGPVEKVEDHEHVEVDIPEVRPLVRKFHTQSGYCHQCRRRVRSRHREQTSTATGTAGIHLGPRSIALASDLKHRLGVTYRKTADLLWVAFRFPVSAGGLWRAIARMADKSIPSYLALVEKLRLSSVVCSDETGWRIGSDGAWLWVFATSELTVYVIASSRNCDVPEQVLGEGFAGILLTDGWQAYQSLPYRKAQCSRHLVRHCDELLDVSYELAGWPGARYDRRRRNFPHAIKSLLLAAIRLKRWQGQMSPVRYLKKVKALRERFRRLIRRRPAFPGNARLAKHLRRHRSEVLLFLTEPELPATNNLAEQQIRPAVVLRKISAGNRTNAGALVHQVLATVTQTAHRHGQRFVDFAPSLLTSPQPLIAPLRVLTDISPGGTLEPVRRNGSELGRKPGEGNLATPPSQPRRIHRHPQRHRGPHRRTGWLTRGGQTSGPSPP